MPLSPRSLLPASMNQRHHGERPYGSPSKRLGQNGARTAQAPHVMVGLLAHWGRGPGIIYWNLTRMAGPDRMERNGRVSGPRLGVWVRHGRGTQGHRGNKGGRGKAGGSLAAESGVIQGQWSNNGVASGWRLVARWSCPSEAVAVQGSERQSRGCDRWLWDRSLMVAIYWF
jgi:hypothetical protein